jgi:phenylalanyl-tRNA synthetase beta chain
VPASSVTYGGEFVDDRGNVIDRSFDSLDIRVTLESLDCRRFVAQRISGVRVRPAKTWMRVRLALAGQRPISNIVDISNFVMLELGQPLHFYDFEKIAGAHLIVRDGISGESITTLDGVTRELDATALVIADDVQPSCLAGLLGGSVSEVSDTTRELVIEAANFSGPRIRRMSVKLGVRTEASSRHEKGLPLGLPDIGAARAARLLEQEGATIHYPRPFGKTAGDPPTIALTRRHVERLLGFTLDDAALHAALASLGFTVKSAGDGAFLVTVPAWRTDVAIAADLVEEIARVVGYDRLVDAIPAIEAQPLTSAAFDREMEIAATLAGLGYHECMTLALQPLAVAQRWRAAGIAVPDLVEIINPLSEDQRWMRFSLLPALLAHAARERTTRPLHTFEIGHVFANSDGEPHETNVVALLATTPSPAARVAWRDDAFLAAKSDVLAFLRRVCGADATTTRGNMPGLHPGKTAELRFGEDVAGWVGVVDPRLARAYDIDADAVAAVLLIDALPAKAVRSAVTLSRYPAIERDLALVVAPDVAAGDIVDASRATALVRRVDVFDEYRGPQIGEGKKSLALRVTLQSDTATLTDADADAAIATIIAGLRERFGAVLRG